MLKEQLSKLSSNIAPASPKSVSSFLSSPQGLLLHFRASPWPLETGMHYGEVSQEALPALRQSLGETQTTPSSPRAVLL